jgi:hypothetical protein
LKEALLRGDWLGQLPIDVEVYERREQLKKSGLGKVVNYTLLLLF